MNQTLTESQRTVLGDMLARKTVTEFERGQLAAWRRSVSDPHDRQLLDRVAALEVK
jgi:hypothetical protein